MALVRYKKTVVASASNSAAGTTRGRLDLTAEAGNIYGGIITAKITNGATGPTVPCRINVLISHETTLPAEGSAGALEQTGKHWLRLQLRPQAMQYWNNIGHLAQR